jgi:hypothetical protein
MLSDRGGIIVREPPSEVETATAKVETMLAMAPNLGISVDALNATRLRLEAHEAMFDAAFGSSRRAELERLMADDVAKLAESFKVMARAVKRGGEA